ncbi:MAG: ribosome small subunit-dependent GTPase A [Bacteroidales bacterium]|nr:ribosome small subunit-dependent GTPase A [Bacteroidales bacterium]
MKENTHKGIVYKSTGSWYYIKSGNEKFKCKIRGKLRTKGFKSTNPIAVGDYVFFDIEEDNTGVITEIAERKNSIVRQATNLSRTTHIIASNVDQAVIIVSLNEPETPVEFIDRFLISCEVYNIPAKIIFNKIDIYEQKHIDLVIELTETYENIGYECLSISVKENINIQAVKNLLKDKTSAIAGNSGVGKSSLINAISSELNLKTTEVSNKHKTGKHTTTFAEMFELKFGGFVIDTPGIKAFGTDFIEKELIAQNFPEMFELLSQCKYHNCKHIDEPGCAVKEAFENGEIAYTRYKSYLNIMLEESGKHRKEFWT